jgi:hypothetical protein
MQRKPDGANLWLLRLDTVTDLYQCPKVLKRSLIWVNSRTHGGKTDAARSRSAAGRTAMQGPSRPTIRLSSCLKSPG